MKTSGEMNRTDRMLPAPVTLDGQVSFSFDLAPHGMAVLQIPR